MKYKLFKRASAIHTVKCKKSADFNEATASFEKLQYLKNSLQSSDEEELSAIENEIENWKNSNPIASENEIKKILK
ncbi:hypothetical protein AB3G34_01790 [Flavobacterium sp. WC2409]|uniref:Addiction module protein n=1 Tax=Flavobacterium sp. WC2409 TaxID=3234139 RepID=A0AB39W4R6_9FLAO